MTKAKCSVTMSCPGVHPNDDQTVWVVGALVTPPREVMQTVGPGEAAVVLHQEHFEEMFERWALARGLLEPQQ